MNFLKLHTASGKEIRINMNLVKTYGTFDNTSRESEKKFIGMTSIVFNYTRDRKEYMYVKETPEEIDRMLFPVGVGSLEHALGEIK